MSRPLASTHLGVLMGVPQFPPPVVGGLERQAWLLSRQLGELGVHVTVLSGQIATSTAVDNTGPVTVTRLRWSRSRWVRACQLPAQMLDFFRHQAPEISVVHAHVFSGFGLGLIVLAKLFGKPIVVKLPNVGAGGLPGLRRWSLGRMRLWLLCKADAVVALSTESIRELLDAGYDPRRILATPNGIRVPTKPVARARTLNRIRMVFVGRLVEQKGVVDLVKALAQIGRSPDWSLDLYGDGPLRNSLATYVRDCGLTKAVRFMGYAYDVQECLHEYDLFVLPSHREGNSNAILEAMAAGLPVVSTRVGGTPMLVGPAGERLLYDAGEISALAALLRWSVANADEAQRIGLRMRERIEMYFDIRQIARTYDAAYRLLADRRRNEIYTLSNPVICWPGHVPCAG